ncbi:Synerg-CTERM system glutamic-type intramembrane protease MrtS [Cloacibacillus evryensis]|uniref:Synerg-CTERM system glutamic-type intramembrane protease MrtS n=1 Tax=Cloacibacillus evryensis TaxID=508460 RepID=UPI00241D9DB0|nr:Synerg-CTERM system glutamic-type intramembrane protease MrtS [Cloacibacillus evryensis]
MGTVVSFCAGVFLLYWPYVWCWYGKKDPDDYGLRWDFNIKDFMQTLAVSAFILLILTVVAMNWPWETLPRKRALWEALSLGGSGLAAAIIEETFFRGWLQPMLERRFSPFAAIVLTNLVFAPIHLIVAPYWISLCTFFPGLIMGWLKYRYKNLFPPALFHFVGNIWSIWFFPLPVKF